jgi:sporulation protein YlmC with PRC-barrel domain
MNLVRDILDALLLDQHGRSIGRVDGLVLELREKRPPKVAAIAVGAKVLAHRVHPRFARWFREPVRVPLNTIRDIGVDIELELDDKTDAALQRNERWIARRIIARIPGGRK